MNLDYTADTKTRILRVIKEFGYFAGINCISFFGLILIQIFKIINLIFNIKFNSYFIILVFFIAFIGMVNSYKKNHLLRKMVSAYFCKKRRKYLFAIFSLIFAYSMLQLMGGTFIYRDQLPADILGVSIFGSILGCTVAYTAMERFAKVICWAIFPYLERKEQVNYTKGIRIVGNNSKYLTHDEIYSYIILTIIWIFLVIVLVIYISGYITSVISFYSDIHDDYIWIAKHVKLASDVNFNLMDLIQIIAVFYGYQKFYSSFREKLCTKIKVNEK